MVLQNWFPQEIKSPVFNLRKFSKTDKITAESCRMHWYLMKDEEFGSFKCLKLKYRRGQQIIQLFCRIGYPQEIRSPVFSLRKYWNWQESNRMHWNLMNEEQFGSFKCLKLKYRRESQKNQPFCRIGSPQEVRSPPL